MPCVDASSLARLTDVSSSIADLRKAFCRSLGLPADDLVPLGFHGDGVPHQHGRSVQVFSWCYLALAGAERILFSVISKDLCCKCGCLGRHTLDAITSIFAWSMQILLVGRYPDTRHDGAAWKPTDKARAKLTGAIGARAVLLQARGDWSWLKELFGFPSWASKQICWLCEAGHGDKPYTDFGLSALWRRHRRTPQAFFQKQRQEGIPISPLLKCPGFP